jgi:methylenetetrahydrofolate--tRNA-(uracil-5-)-methyltransferase
MGALLAHITGVHACARDPGAFQPMNVNFGLFPPLPEPEGQRRKERGGARKRSLATRALAELEPWLRSAGRARALE